MMSLNDNEKDFQKKLQEETEIPLIVHERVNQAYRLIENNTAVQKKAPKEPYHWMKLGGELQEVWQQRLQSDLYSVQ